MGTPDVVEIEGLEVRYGTFKAVDGISLNVRAGEIFGILGANGAGKTTTIRVLCGLLRPTAGRVRIGGVDPAQDLTAIKGGVGYVSQRFTLYSDLTIEQNLHFTAALRRMDEKQRDRRIRILLEVIKFYEPLSTLVQDLSGGHRQEVSIVAAMLHDPQLIILDEPTAGVSPNARLRLWNLVRQIADLGKTIFIATHHMDEAEQCDRLAFMREGKIIALDTPGELKIKAFPEPMYALSAGEGAPERWIDRVRGDSSVFTATCHGLRWHVGIRDEEAFRRLLEGFGGSVRSERISPSLEDAFVRLGKKQVS
ncbi:MAG: ABC transporter ATP-binding protein [Elusimicrobia bacterium]|nr:ABC transporter ATP-binding protein [Elusimicrobiota bacterium]